MVSMLIRALGPEAADLCGVAGAREAAGGCVVPGGCWFGGGGLGEGGG
jgi:hypothetical protein